MTMMRQYLNTFSFMLMMLFSVLSLKMESDRNSAMTIMKYKKS